jgi:Ca2+-binding EF-hand superfamily protein
MRKQAMKVGGAFLFALAAAASAAASDNECRVAWERADINKDGFVSGSEMTPYLIAIKKDGRHNDAVRDGKLDRNEFLKVCRDGIFEGINLQVWDARRN